MHGGKSRAAISSPRFKSGRYSKYLPARLLARYEEAAADADLLALRDEAALLDARTCDLLAKVDDRDCPAFYKAALKQAEAARHALSKQDNGALVDAIDGLAEISHLALLDFATWNEIQATIEQRRRVVETESRRLVQMRQMLTTEQAMTLVASVAMIVRRHVADTESLAGIAADIRKLVEAPGQKIDLEELSDQQLVSELAAVEWALDVVPLRKPN